MLKYTYRRSMSTKQSYRPKVIEPIDSALSLYSMAFCRWFVVMERWRHQVMVLCLSFCTDTCPHTSNSNEPKHHRSRNILVRNFPLFMLYSFEYWYHKVMHHLLWYVNLFYHFYSWVNYSIIRRFVKAPVNCAATPDALKEPHSYVFQSEILLLGSDKVTAALPQNSCYNTSRTSIVMYWKLGGYDPNRSEDVSGTGLVGLCMSSFVLQLKHFCCRNRVSTTLQIG